MACKIHLYFYFLLLVDLPPVNRIPYLCNATDKNNNHPPEFMFDNKESTYWQSSAGIDKATIIIDIQSVSQPVSYNKNMRNSVIYLTC